MEDLLFVLNVLAWVCLLIGSIAIVYMGVVEIRLVRFYRALLKKENIIHPIGSYYVSVALTKVSEVNDAFGGEWELIDNYGGGYYYKRIA